MGSRDHGFAAAGSGEMAELHRLPRLVRTVVDAGQDVHVQVDHQVAGVPAVASPSSCA